MAHGRKGMTDSVNPGAPTAGVPFPGTNAALFATTTGETMAETRNRVMCGGACSMSVDLAFKDYWLPAAPATNEVDACYAAGINNVLTNAADTTSRFACASSLPLGAVAPVAPACRTNLTTLCRITIHYERHIHPLWGLDRLVDVGGVVTNNKCNSCHAPVNAANAAQVPAGDLDLSDGPSEEQPLHFKSYRELLFGDRGQIVNNMGQLEDECLEFQTDPVTNVMTCVAFRNVPASMSSNGAAASARFFNKMSGATAGTVDHRDFMSASELRLLSEWLDIGAQYYNDPFTAPEN
jgi:hypothetical protein